jgi:hypothetical protein
MTGRDPKTGRFPKGSGIPANGPGWGGAAKGEGTKERFSDENQPAGEVKSAGHNAAREVRELIAAKRVALAEKLLTLAENGETQAIQLQATNAALDRLMGRPAQSVDVTSGGEKLPGYVMTAPAEIEDADAWATQHKPKAP